MMDDKNMPDVIWSRHVPYEGYVPLQNQDCYHEDTDIQYTRTQAIVELLEGMIQDAPIMNYTEDNYNAGFVHGLSDAIEAIKDIK